MIFSSWELLSPHLVFLVRLVLQKELPCNSSPLPSWLMWPEDHRILSPSLTSYLDSLRIPGKKTRFTRYQWITECEQSSWQTFNNFKYYLKRLHFILPLSLHLIHSQENLLGYRCGHPVSLPFGCLAAHFPSQPPTLLPCLYRKGNFSLTPLPVGLDSLERDATTVGDSDAIRFIEEVWPTRFSLSCERNAWQLTTCRAHFAHDLFRIRVVILNSNVLKTLAKAPTNTAPSRSFLFVTEKNWNRTFFSQCLVTEKTLSWRLINFNRSDFFPPFRCAGSVSSAAPFFRALRVLPAVHWSILTWSCQEDTRGGMARTMDCRQADFSISPPSLARSRVTSFLAPASKCACPAG